MRELMNPLGALQSLVIATVYTPPKGKHMPIGAGSWKFKDDQVNTSILGSILHI